MLMISNTFFLISNPIERSTTQQSQPPQGFVVKSIDRSVSFALTMFPFTAVMLRKLNTDFIGFLTLHPTRSKSWACDECPVFF